MTMPAFGSEEFETCLEFVRLHCLNEGATYEDALAFCVAHTAVTLQTMIARQERDAAPAKLH